MSLRKMSNFKGNVHYPHRGYWIFVAGFALSLLFAVLLWTNEAIADDKQKMGIATSKETVSGSVLSSLTQGEVSGVPYYRCQVKGRDASSEEVSLILLHGAAFTKEDWKASGILDDFCGRDIFGSLNVVALDLPTKADFQDLQRVLDAMEAKSLIHRKPVTLITPSAGGRTMVSWAASPSAAVAIPKYIQKWIPVASNSINNTPDQSVKELAAVPILAIYGDQDVAGKRSSERLKTLAKAQMVELKGRHPCYLDSPKEFVEEVLKFVEN